MPVGQLSNGAPENNATSEGVFEQTHKLKPYTSYIRKAAVIVEKLTKILKNKGCILANVTYNQ